MTQQVTEPPVHEVAVVRTTDLPSRRARRRAGSPAAADPLDGRTPTAGARRFLPEVQALRALAVALVVVYHVRPSLVPGGFVGVDVFFVISGYLITGHMLREVRRTGTLRLGTFWANRARRILPAGLLTVLVVTFAATRILSPDQWPALARQGLASVLYVQNWVLAADSVDYLAADDPATVFQHFWSLAVEEQFYLLWPLLVLAVAFVVRRRWGARRLGPALLVVLGAVVAASFVWSVVAVRAGDASAYFATTTRLWELGAGGLLAVALRPSDRLVLGRSLLALVGLAAIGVAAFAFDGATPFPGASAVLPVLGAAAVIAAGRTRGLGSLTPLVDRRPVQWLGNVSYSLYLWHFPVVVLFAAHVGRTPTLTEDVAVVAVSLAAAAVSYALVEQPTRSWAWLRSRAWRPLALAAGAMGVVGLVAGLVPTHQPGSMSQWSSVAAQVSADVRPGAGYGAESVRGAPKPFLGGTPRMSPDPLELGKDVTTGIDPARCVATTLSTTTPQCAAGDLASPTTVVVVGDSHARALSTAIVGVAEQRHWKVVTFLHDSCPFSAATRKVERSGGIRCKAANSATMDAILSMHPAAVVTTAWGGEDYVDDQRGGGGPQSGVRGFVQYWDRLSDTGIRVFAVRDTPQPTDGWQSCITRNYSDPDRCAMKRSVALQGRDVIPDAVRIAKRATLIDLTDRYCTKTRCALVVGDVLVYRDQNHMSDVWSRTLVTAFEKALPTHL